MENIEADQGHRRPRRPFDKAHDVKLADKVNRRAIMIEKNPTKVECV